MIETVKSPFGLLNSQAIQASAWPNPHVSCVQILWLLVVSLSDS